MKQAETLILLYHFTDAEKVERIKDVLRQMKVRFKEVPDAQAGQKIGFLIGAKGFGEQPATPEAEAFAEEMMIMQGVDRKRLDALLTAFRAAGVSRIALKALVTPRNLFWTLDRLGRTIQKEHSAMAAGRE